jgi:Pyridine nucleotide-disulphide oxidoreductase, dimerisation domain
MCQAGIAASDILGQAHQPASYRALPRVTFTDPEVGAVGLTEAQACGRDVTVQTAVSPIPSSSRGWIHGPGNDGFIKLIANADAGILIGATSAEPADGEVRGALAVAAHAQVPVAMLSQMIYAYPTFHRAIENAIAQLSLRRAGSNHGPRHTSQGRAASAGPFPIPFNPYVRSSGYGPGGGSHRVPEGHTHQQDARPHLTADASTRTRISISCGTPSPPCCLASAAFSTHP